VGREDVDNFRKASARCQMAGYGPEKIVSGTTVGIAIAPFAP